MKYDDTFSDSGFNVSSRSVDSTVESASNSIVARRREPAQVALAATKNYDLAHAEETRQFTPPPLDKFLPSPKRWLIIGGVFLAGAVGTGIMGATVLPHRTTVKAPAVVAPAGEVHPIQSGQGGDIENIFAQEHEVLKAGQMIGSFDNSPLRIKLSQIETQIAQTQKKIDQIEKQRNTLSQTAIIGSFSRLEYSNSLLLEHRRELEAILNRDRNQLAQTQQQLDNLIVRTPIAGTLYGLRMSQVGQTIGSDETIAKMIPTGAELEIQAVVSGSDIDNIEVGYPTRIQLSNCSTLGFSPIQGKIHTIEPMPAGNNAASLKNHLVTVKPEAQSLQSGLRTCKLLPGTEGQLTIIAKQETLFDFFIRKIGIKVTV